MSKDQRDGSGVCRPLMDEVDVYPIDRQLVLTEGIDPGLSLPPVKILLPVMCQFLQCKGY